ncbi:MAG TPA: hypothetical protein VGT24_07610 [Candidatus Acidoferrales bacterium]|nr:hypothetical protein [Candidatus Acidoferrales bacterium]
MNTGRRMFLSGMGAVMAGARAMLASGQRQGPPPQFPQIPDASDGADRDTPLPKLADPKEQLKEGQKTLRRDVDHLLQMAKDLKEETDKTKETDVLSLSLVKKAEDIEKLARQIKERIRSY